MAGRATPEGILKDQVIGELEHLVSIGYRVQWWCTHDDAPGIPDLIICAAGRYVALELKVDAKLDPRQELFLAQVADAEGISAILKKYRDSTIGVTQYCLRHQYQSQHQSLPFALGYLFPDVPLTYLKR
jgi:hypothetical protein